MTPKSRLSRTEKHRLTAHGYSIESAYRSHLNMRSGEDAREAYEQARKRWASAHGLEPDYGAYLVELQEHECTLPQLEENLAACSQSVAMVRSALRELIEQGLVERAHSASPRHDWPNRDMANAELDAATVALDACRHEGARPHAMQDEDDRDSQRRAL